ncbi:MAG: sensor histidine kinase [Firmicutes bacterium]|nr:sensor histidine kinase [Bacillota bacterium]
MVKKKYITGLLRDFFKSVQGTLILYFVTIAVIPTFLLGFITYSTSSRIIDNKVQIYVEQMIIKVKENIEYYFRDLQSLAYMISVNTDLLTALREETFLDRWKEINYNNKLKHFLASLTSTRAEVRGIYVVSEDERRIYSSGPPILISYLQGYDWYQAMVNSDEHLFITDIHEDNYADAPYVNPSKVVTYAQRITDLDGRKLGWVLIDLNYSFVTKMLERLELWEQGQVTVLDSKGKLIFGDQAAAARYQENNFRQLYLRDWGSLLQIIEGKKELVVYQAVSFCGWKVIFSIDYGILQKEIITLRNIILVMAIFLLGGSIYLAVHFAGKVSGPVHILCDSMKEVEEGNLEVAIRIRSMKEFNRLAASFNQMVERIRNLMDNIYEVQQKKRQAELNALQAQINPHFLYNTLDSLRWLAKIHNIEEIGKIISALENLLRASITKTNDLITIGEEIENGRNYLAIQLFRYGNNFTATFGIDPSVTSYLTPRLILQPIVENAIYHGVGNMIGGEIEIGVHSDSTGIIFEVLDNGPGIDPDKVKAIIEGKHKNKDRFSGFGLMNVAERIGLYFDRDYEFKIENRDSQGTRILIRIPRISKLNERSIANWVK